MVEATFRGNFPEFASTTVYTTGMITFWSGVAEKILNTTRWNAFNLYDEGIMLFTAHQLVMAAKDQATAALGGIPGGSSGVISSKSADVTISYDNSATIEDNAGHFNQTSYGRQFIRLARLVGMGGAQL